MKRVVVDTHVLMASLLGGEARLVMRYWWEGKVALVLSEEIVGEYLGALARLGEMDASSSRQRRDSSSVSSAQPRRSSGSAAQGALARLGEMKEAARDLVEAFGRREGVVWVGTRLRQASFAKATEPEGYGGQGGGVEGAGANAPAEQGGERGEGRSGKGGAGLRPALEKFVEAAVAGKAEAIIAGDAELVERGGYRGIPILTAGQWLEERFGRRE